MKIIYLHGFASGQETFKGQFFKEKIRLKYKQDVIIPDLNVPSFETMTFNDQIELIAKELDEPTIIIGSSLGAFLAVLLAEKFPTIKGLILLAPAFEFYSRFLKRFDEKTYEIFKERKYIEFFHQQEKKFKKFSFQSFINAKKYEKEVYLLEQNSVVFHGYNDTDVPYELSIKYLSNKKHCKLFFFNDDHSLVSSLPKIWEISSEFINLTRFKFS
jgi:predicted esterase YcpF (UPF0227 family)